MGDPPFHTHTHTQSVSHHHHQRALCMPVVAVAAAEDAIKAAVKDIKAKRSAHSSGEGADGSGHKVEATA